MPWNGSGVFARLFSWVADRDGGIDILADRMDQDTDDIAQGMMHCLTVNGETVPVANLPMANFRHTGASVGVADTDYATLGQIKNGGGGLAGGLLPAAGGTITGDLAVTGNTTLGGTLAVTGVASLAGLTATTAAFAGTLSATGAFSGVAGSFSATLTVGGATTLHALTATGLILNGNGTVNGDLTLSGAGADLTVGGSSALHAVTATTGNFSSTLTVAGTANLAGVNTTGALSVGGTLTAGTANFSNDVTISGGGSTLTVGGGGLVVNGSAATRALACTTLTNSDRMTPMAGILPGTGGLECGDAGAPWGSVTAVAIVQTSDAAIKTDIASLPAALPLVAAIEPRRYRYRVPMAPGQGGVHWGFVAQEVGAAMTAAGHDFAGHQSSGGRGCDTLAPSELVAVLWKAVQELSARVAELESGRG